MYVKHARGWVKGAVDVTLGPRTLIVGPNEAGKTAIRNVIELALAGGASGIGAGAFTTAKGAINTLGPPDESPQAVVEMDDGTTCRYGVTAPGEVMHALSMEDIRTKLYGLAQNARAWVLSTGGASLSDEAVKAHLGERTVAALAALVGKRAWIDALPDVLDRATKLAADKTREANAQRKVLVQMQAPVYMGPPVAELEATLQRTEQELRACEQALAAWQRQNGDARRRQDAERRYREHAAIIEEYGTWLVDAGEPPPVPVAEGQVDAETRAFYAWVLKAVEANSNYDDCVACRAPLDRADQAEYADQLRSMLAPVPTVDPYAQWRADVVEARAMVAQATAARDAAHAEIERYGGGVLAEEPDTARGDALRAQARKLSEQIGEARAAVAQSLRHERVSADVLAQENAAEDLKAAVKAGRKVVTMAAQQAAQTVEAAVNRYLPDGDRMFIRVVDGDGKPAFDFGMWRGDRADTALSAATRTRLLLAFGAAVAELSGKPSVLLADDHQWDAVTLARTLDALSTSAVAQVVIETTVRPAYYPDGWTVIDFYGTDGPPDSADDTSDEPLHTRPPTAKRLPGKRQAMSAADALVREALGRDPVLDDVLVESVHERDGGVLLRIGCGDVFTDAAGVVSFKLRADLAA